MRWGKHIELELSQAGGLLNNPEYRRVPVDTLFLHTSAFLSKADPIRLVGKPFLWRFILRLTNSQSTVPCSSRKHQKTEMLVVTWQVNFDNPRAVKKLVSCYAPLGSPSIIGPHIETGSKLTEVHISLQVVQCRSGPLLAERSTL